ncbi:MAG: adenylyl-sulfate kinase [Bdellovibrionales bacterium]|nr:adenylyl-sulfate kinase [Bdellovibrionales bacterium]
MTTAGTHIRPPAKVIWLTGISGAGKSTLGEKLFAYFSNHVAQVEFLDGNEVRDFFDNDLGFTDEERHMAIKRSVFGSYLLAKNGVHVIVASIAASYEIRDFIRTKLGDHYIQVWVKASVDTVRKRDVRGLYKAHDEGDEENLPGVDQGYDKPRNPHIVIETDSDTIDASFEKLRSFLAQHLEFE